MMSPWRYFSLDELKCKCGQCGSTGMEMNYDFMQHLVRLRQAMNMPLMISSGYRCSTYNKIVSTTDENGPHTTGKAVDILIYGEPAFTLVYEAMKAGFMGIGIKQRGEMNSRFIHLDRLKPSEGFPRPRIWSY